MSDGNVERKIEVCSGVSEKVVSGARVVMATGPLTMGAHALAVATGAASARDSDIRFWWWLWRMSVM